MPIKTPDSGDRYSVCRRKKLGFRRTLCCSFVTPRSPENFTSRHPSKPSKSDVVSKPYNSYPNSPSPSASSKLGLGLGLGLIDPRRILSPGRVSPIDSDAALESLPENASESELDSLPPAAGKPIPPEKIRVSSSSMKMMAITDGIKSKGFDVRLDLKGRGGGRLVLELDHEVLYRSSPFFATKIVEFRNGPRNLGDCCVIEVGDVEDLAVFRETIELMYEKDITRHLMKAGASRSIDILEVSSIIMFELGVRSCLKYLEAVPWSESEEEKLKNLFTKCKFDGSIALDMLTRLYSQNPITSQPLAIHIIQSVTSSTDLNARKELKSFVKGLLSTSSVYQKDPSGLNKEGLYNICNTCLQLLVLYFEEASNSVLKDWVARNETERPLIERISKQVDNLNWVFEILLDKQMAEEFVGLWGNQRDLFRMHQKASPMVRYELSRITAHVFIALGRGKLQCHGEVRYGVFRAWFEPMLMDFGWLQRCSKGLDVRELEEAMGQALLTLPLKRQQSLFVEWFGYFSRFGTECPNLSKAFQVWWRRSFSRASESSHMDEL